MERRALRLGHRINAGDASIGAEDVSLACVLERTSSLDDNERARGIV